MGVKRILCPFSSHPWFSPCPGCQGWCPAVLVGQRAGGHAGLPLPAGQRKGGARCRELSAVGGYRGGPAAPTTPGCPARGLARGHSPLPAEPAVLKAGAAEPSSVPTVHLHYFGTPWDPLGWRWTRSCQGMPSPPELGLQYLQTMQTGDEVQSSSRRFRKFCSAWGFHQYSQG